MQKELIGFNGNQLWTLVSDPIKDHDRYQRLGRSKKSSLSLEKKQQSLDLVMGQKAG